jgi:hypothetical protein
MAGWLQLEHLRFDKSLPVFFQMLPKGSSQLLLHSLGRQSCFPVLFSASGLYAEPDMCELPFQVRQRRVTLTRRRYCQQQDWIYFTIADVCAANLTSLVVVFLQRSRTALA